ncbi:MAG: DUF4783 domain-containing protein [Bacteroidetes bacterium]|nr:DUF4783 domain-containing protein [Bacteroidota bacterium]
MKRISIFIFSLLLVTSISAKLYWEMNPDEISNDIAIAIKSGNSKELAKFFNTSIDLKVPSNDETFSKAQAELIMKDFFQKNPPKSFTINHQGSSNDGSKYSIGTYVSSTGSFRTYFLLKKVGNSFFIQQLQFELQ